MRRLEELRTESATSASSKIVSVEKLTASFGRNLDSSCYSQSGQESRQLQKHDLDVLTWLSPTTFANRQKDILLQAQPGTGEWVLTSDAFKNWLASPASSQTLWLVGIPGSGKTTLASIVVD